MSSNELYSGTGATRITSNAEPGVLRAQGAHGDELQAGSFLLLLFLLGLDDELHGYPPQRRDFVPALADVRAWTPCPVSATTLTSTTITKSRNRRSSRRSESRLVTKSLALPRVVAAEARILGAEGAVRSVFVACTVLPVFLLGFDDELHVVVSLVRERTEFSCSGSRYAFAAPGAAREK